MTPAVKPTLGRIVVYKSKIDNGPGNDVLSPAIVVLTRNTVIQSVLDRWGPEPTEVGPSPLDGRVHTTLERPDTFTIPEDDEHVSLLVFGLGKTYHEHNVAHGDGLGQWRWPQEVPECNT